MGNFLGNDLPGRPTNMLFGMYFPGANGIAMRHPSQIYQGILEGLLPFFILWYFKDKIQVCGVIFALWFVIHGFFRFLSEFFREPDSFLGYYFQFFSLGQLLCVVEIIFGGVVLLLAFRKSAREKLGTTGNSCIA